MLGVPRVDAGGLVVSLAQVASLMVDDTPEMASLRDLADVKIS